MPDLNKLYELKEDLQKVNSELNALLNNLESLKETHKIIDASKWEYKIHNDLDSLSLNKLGMLGWEVAGISSYQTGGGISIDGSGSSLFTVHVMYVLKRMLPKASTHEIDSLYLSIEKLDVHKAALEAQIKLDEEKAKADELAEFQSSSSNVIVYCTQCNAMNKLKDINCFRCGNVLTV